MKYKTIIAATTLIFLIIPISTAAAFAQVQQQLPPQANKFLAGPSKAQIQADIANTQNSPEGKALQHIKDEIAAAGEVSSQHLSAVLTNMTQHGLISCPLPINVNHLNCIISTHHTPGAPQPPSPSQLPPPNPNAPQPQQP